MVAVVAVAAFSIGPGSAGSDGVAAASVSTAAGKVKKQVRRLAKKVRRQTRAVRRVKRRVKSLDTRVSALEASGGGVKRANYAAAAFTAVEESTHNNMGDSACGAFVPSQQGSENQGDLNAKLGSFLSQVLLPDGARIQRLAMYANDFSAEDAHLYLLRKEISDGLSPQFDGYQVVAQVSTSGAVENTMREFEAPVSDGVVDNAHGYYYLELVVCDAIEPFTAQIAYR